MKKNILIVGCLLCMLSLSSCSNTKNTDTNNINQVVNQDEEMEHSVITNENKSVVNQTPTKPTFDPDEALSNLKVEEYSSANNAYDYCLVITNNSEFNINIKADVSAYYNTSKEAAKQTQEGQCVESGDSTCLYFHFSDIPISTEYNLAVSEASGAKCVSKYIDYTSEIDINEIVLHVNSHHPMDIPYLKAVVMFFNDDVFVGCNDTFCQSERSSYLGYDESVDVKTYCYAPFNNVKVFFLPGWENDDKEYFYATSDKEVDNKNIVAKWTNVTQQDGEMFFNISPQYEGDESPTTLEKNILGIYPLTNGKDITLDTTKNNYIIIKPDGDYDIIHLNEDCTDLSISDSDEICTVPSYSGDFIQLGEPDGWHQLSDTLCDYYYHFNITTGDEHPYGIIIIKCIETWATGESIERYLLETIWNNQGQIELRGCIGANEWEATFQCEIVGYIDSVAQ